MLLVVQGLPATLGGDAATFVVSRLVKAPKEIWC